MRKPAWRRAWALLGYGRLRTLSLVTFSHGFVAVALFAQMVAQARMLSVLEFGHLATMLAVSMVVEAAVGARGSETALATFAEIPGDDLDRRHAVTLRLLRVDLLWSLAIYTVLAGAVIAYVALRGARYEWLLILIAGSLVAYPWGTLKAYLTVFKGPRAFPSIEVSYAATVFFGGVSLGFVWGGLGFVIAMALASLVRTILGFRQAGISLGSMAGEAGPKGGIPRNTLWALGATGTVRSGLLNLAANMDILLLAVASSAAPVGLYRAAKILSPLVQRVTLPVWFVLKRHIIVGSRGDDNAHSRRMVVIAAAGFLAVGAALIPALLYFGGDIIALAFGERYRAGAGALYWLVPGAWILHAVTGWSSLFGSVASERLTVIGIYCAQIALFALVAVAGGITLGSVACAFALSQAMVAACFWMLFLRRR